MFLKYGHIDLKREDKSLERCLIGDEVLNYACDVLQYIQKPAYIAISSTFQHLASGKDHFISMLSAGTRL